MGTSCTPRNEHPFAPAGLSLVVEIALFGMTYEVPKLTNCRASFLMVCSRRLWGLLTMTREYWNVLSMEKDYVTLNGRIQRTISQAILLFLILPFSKVTTQLLKGFQPPLSKWKLSNIFSVQANMIVLNVSAWFILYTTIDWRRRYTYYIVKLGFISYHMQSIESFTMLLFTNSTVSISNFFSSIFR